MKTDSQYRQIVATNTQIKSDLDRSLEQIYNQARRLRDLRYLLRGCMTQHASKWKTERRDVQIKQFNQLNNN
jgi:transposase